MIACDTSVMIAAFARWHTDHVPAAAALRKADALVDHVVIETFSVLTRMPPPRRVPPELVSAFVAAHFPAPTRRLPGVPPDEVVDTATRAGITGGAVYDLVVALAARNGGATLLSLDRRAAPTYEAAGADYQLLT